ncbi:ATP-binding protein [Sphingobacteriales bacterium UPWRP_1]|nr:AAA family ATPase [Sphingobacteriales bacterium TSM_CSM]PSJ74057.1 ATP-binding protein [Sphingobacteriales bacterium UPWRP_1]
MEMLTQHIRRSLEAHIQGCLHHGAGMAVLCLPQPFIQWLQESRLCTEEQILLLLALIPHIHPDFFTPIIQELLPEGGDLPFLGGVRGKNHRGILPTGETALLVLAGTDTQKRLQIQQTLFSPTHFFARHRILYLEEVPEGEPVMSGRLILNPDYVTLFLTGQEPKPQLSPHFPAQLLTTRQTWQDLVLPDETLQQLEELKMWLEHSPTLLQDWGFAGKVKPGYRALFHGPSGTGKTLTATLLGDAVKRDVYRIDLSLIISKYIGETEKNLANLFQLAENKNWILFFDEADALFSKRTEIRDAHDKYANQDAAYLLQRMETFEGIIILATNFQNNLDAAFIRRFNTIVHFPLPRPAERLLLWQKWIHRLPAHITMEKNIDLQHIANQYELTGANIANIFQFICLKTIQAKLPIISQHYLQTAIKSEFKKEKKLV